MPILKTGVDIGQNMLFNRHSQFSTVAEGVCPLVGLVLSLADGKALKRVQLVRG
jgi:hypothetical protein